ncbi:hypothetical protein FD754_025489, partial [Muntiacus muntjak]
EYDKPSLSAWPSPVVPLGQTVTLRCHFRSPLKRFRLFKRHGTSLPELKGHHVNTFTLGPVTREHAGSYTCSGFYRFPPLLHRHSDPLQIVVTGVFTKPVISADPGPLVRAGGNVTLRCQSQLLFDKFILHQENSTGHFQRRGEMFTGGHAPADFSIGPMTSGSEGTYRCYGSLSRSPYVWSAPSDPVDIVITGLVSSPASVSGDNDSRAETLTYSGEGTIQRERRCEHGREKRTEHLPCAKEKTQPVTDSLPLSGALWYQTPLQKEFSLPTLPTKESLPAP